eukprot:TRINITY_DN16458_c0_g1_i1.p2 TRINITY_DN16458_c0_g1~~TRINITY_DN16458_c0_g1_i1.p2  ORF type:complete len:136 (+),score=61.21 TRINITY_DN16458_c0_g1_i1:58-408(+)
MVAAPEVFVAAAAAARRAESLRLYRTILRAHGRVLPPQHRDLGDAYVKAEFRKHRQVKPEFANAFYTEWFRYLQHLVAPSGGGIGRSLTDEEMAVLSDEQREKLDGLQQGLQRRPQ